MAKTHADGSGGKVDRGLAVTRNQKPLSLKRMNLTLDDGMVV